MPRIFLPQGAPVPAVGETVELTGEAAFHLAFVLRAREGESLTLCTREGTELSCSIARILPGKKEPRVACRVLAAAPSLQESPVRIRVFQGLPKGKKTDAILQKCTELGADEICFVDLDRSVPEGKEERKERFEKICQSAAEQCGRGKLVKVSFLPGAERALEEMKKAQLAFLCYEEEKQGSLKELLRQEVQSIAFLIGPEGGLSPREAALFREAGVPAVTLGKRILRTESAAPAVLAMILYEKELT